MRKKWLFTTWTNSIFLFIYIEIAGQGGTHHSEGLCQERPRVNNWYYRHIGRQVSRPQPSSRGSERRAEVSRAHQRPGAKGQNRGISLHWELKDLHEMDNNNNITSTVGYLDTTGKIRHNKINSNIFMITKILVERLMKNSQSTVLILIIIINMEVSPQHLSSIL